MLLQEILPPFWIITLLLISTAIVPPLLFKNGPIEGPQKSFYAFQFPRPFMDHLHRSVCISHSPDSLPMGVLHLGPDHRPALRI